MKRQLTLFLMLITVSVLSAQDKQIYKDPAQPVEKRVEDLINRMTLEEKINLLGGTGVATKENKRLGIPELKMTDGPVGARFEKSTAFPVSIAMAATWNPDVIYRIGKGIAMETKGHGRDVILGPCINIARIPLGGRTFEGMGEDPFLTSRLTVAYIKGIQDNGVAATVKHFAANSQEKERDYVDEFVSRRALNEIYLPAFKAAVTEANSYCIMAAYNKVNGRWACENNYLLDEVLRKQWNYKGLIMSDWWAVHSSVPTAQGELDLEMPNGDYMNNAKLKDAIESGALTVETINKKVKNILTLIFKLGLFEKTTLVDSTLINTPEARKIAYDASLESITLLKNENSILPIKAGKVKTLAVIGPAADTALTGGGGSSEVSPINPVSLLQGLKNKLPKDINIIFARGISFEQNVTPFDAKYYYTDKTGRHNGVNAEYFNNTNLAGVPVLKRVDSCINFRWDEKGPGSGVNTDHYSVRWTGYIKAPVTGDFTIGTISDDGMRFFFEDKKLIDVWFAHGEMIKTARVHMEKGKLYKIQVDLFEKAGGAVAILGSAQKGDKLFNEAIAAAKKADYVLVSVGNSDNVETEGRDRENLDLQNFQDDLIEKAASVNKNVVVVLTTGAPVVMDRWIKKVKGVVETWFPGSEGGNAIADILLGNYNPSGKLPITFPRKWEDCSAFPSYDKYPERTYYTDDIYVGYRHYDKYNIEPLFPFGYGLSYTTFEYSDLNVSGGNGSYTVTFKVKNTGSVKGAEAAQVYVASTGINDRPVKELKGFAKVSLEPGETKTATVKLDKSSFAYFNEHENTWKEGTGIYKISVGSSSRDLELNSEAVIK